MPWWVAFATLVTYKFLPTIPKKTSDYYHLHNSKKLMQDFDIPNTSGWIWTQVFLGELPILHQVYQVSRFMKTTKLGVEDSQSTKRYFEMNQIEDNNIWKGSMPIEIDQLHAHETYIVLEDHQSISSGYKRVSYHYIYDVKYDGRKKFRLIAGGHMTDPLNMDIFSSIVSM